MSWRSGSDQFNEPCDRRGRTQSDHTATGHGWTHALAGSDMELTAGEETYLDARIRNYGRVKRGLYDAPLPPPKERRRIRERAGLTQEKVAEIVHVNRITVLRWEKKSGYEGGRRLPGRELSGERREDYSQLLRSLEKTSEF